MEEHVTVLSDESIQGLNLAPRKVVVDATVGQGGHALHIARRIGAQGTLVAVDADETSLAHAKEVLKDTDAHLIYVHGNFRDLGEHMRRIGVTSADAILFDLGWHQGQLLSGRGFSFKEDAPLLMTLSAKPEGYELTAKDIIADWDEEELVKLFKEYGGERFSGRIARTIVETRKRTPIDTAKELADLVVSAVPHRFRAGPIHPATRVFQALRIAVNDELNSLKEGLSAALSLLAPHGRVAVITFHSLEDKIVKNLFRDAEKEGRGIRITKKPLTPTRTEVLANPRARSAKLRIFEKHA